MPVYKIQILPAENLCLQERKHIPSRLEQAILSGSSNRSRQWCSAKYGTSELQGSGIFILDAGATLGSGHPAGIMELKNTGIRTLSAQTSYSFNDTIAQVTGDLLPDDVENLIMDNNTGVTLSNQ